MRSTTRVVLIGQAAFGEQVLDGLLARGHAVAAVYCRPDAPGAKPDPLKVRALGLGIPVLQHPTLNGREVAREFAAHGADLGVLAYVTQIVPATVFDAPRYGSICFHPSLLPRYRGGSAIPWQIIRGEERTGVTVFWVDAGIDTGPILLQKEATILPDDTAATLYYNTLFKLGVEAMLEAVDRVAAGTAPRRMQDESRATYDPLCGDAHARVDWCRPVAALYNLIRGCDPHPGAFIERAGEKLRFYDARLADGRGVPGTILAIGADGITVAAADGAIRIARLRAGGHKIPASEAAGALKLLPGDAFDADPHD
ncbi:MAG: methionyl-tRNA formyltransferase [Candidatus Binatia bacterium]